jgi:hypothetical protein
VRHVKDRAKINDEVQNIANKVTAANEFCVDKEETKYFNFLNH